MGNNGSRRIALATWYGYHNYGTALQVTALCRVLRMHGHRVDVVDYQPKGTYVSRPEWGGPMSELRSLACRGIKRVRGRGYTPEARERLFDTFLAEQLTFTSPCPTLAELEGLNGAYDAFVCGSDQIWAPSVFDPHYFLDFAGGDRLKVAYAPSVGLPSVEDPDVARQMTRLCRRFDALSTREESGSRIVSELTGREVATVLDPTLLLSREAWGEIADGADLDTREPYLLAYMLGESEAHWRRVYALAGRLGLPVRVVPVFRRDLRREGCIEEPVGPREFLALVEHASYVCTDSFHGTAFSINLERDFCVFERFKQGDAINQNSRIYNILDKVGLRSRLATADVSDEQLVESVDWVQPREKLLAERKHSINWLRSALEMELACLEGGDNVARDRSLCCGCTACEVTCPVGAVGVSLDEDGFWSAHVDEGSCISCARCREVCPFVEHSSSVDLRGGSLFSYKCSDADQLLTSSSGGAGAMISETAASTGTAVFGCAFDPERGGAVSKLVMPKDAAALALLAGSKYMQSEVGGALAEAAAHKGPLLVTGTPCQVAAARNLLDGRGDVSYVDLICHGVPSRNLYARYREWLNVEHDIALEGGKTVFRYKPRGWRERYIYTADGENEACLSQREDPYFLLFEAGQCYAGCCYECPWRATSAADVRIGDYWGPKFKSDITGVSMLLALTERGREIVGGLRTTGDVVEQPLEDYLSWQQVENFSEPVFRDELLSKLGNPDLGIETVCNEFAKPIACRRDMMRKLEPLVIVVKRLLGRR